MQMFLSDINKRNVVVVLVPFIHIFSSVLVHLISAFLLSFLLPPSPSTSVPSCLQVPTSPAPIKLNWLKRRDRDTLLPIIRTYILPGTRVMSDKWKAYDCLQDKGYQYLTVNHTLNFVDPDTGAHTQGIENTWWGGKRDLPRKGTSKDLFESCLHEFLCRKHYEEDPFGNIIKHIVEL